MFGAATTRADTFQLDFLPTNTFTGTAPAGSLTATFTDVAGGVQLKIDSSLAAGENLDPKDALYLNLNPSKDALLGSLLFTKSGDTGFSQAAVVKQGKDAFKADGDGSYDFLFTYSSATKAFKGGESQTYTITGSGIVADDFKFLSQPPTGGNGFWLAAVHVQNTPSGGSGSAFVGATEHHQQQHPTPEPSTLAIAGLGALGFLAYGLRRRKTQ
jgi:hypothetical protein